MKVNECVVKNFKKRRYLRLLSRMDDADDEGQWITTENGHRVHLSENGIPDLGNRHVIEKMMSGGSTRTVKRQKIQTVAMPTEFKKGPGKKVLTSFNKYLEGLDVESHVSDLLANSQDLIDRKSPDVFDKNFSLKVTNTTIASKVRCLVNDKKMITSATLKLPDVNSYPEEFKWCAAGIFAHEYMHYLNLCASEGNGYSSYTDADNELSDAIKSANITSKNINSEIVSVLKAHKDEVNKKLPQIVESTRKKLQNVLDAYHKNLMSYNEARKLLNDVKKRAKLEEHIVLSGANGGAATLSNLYDALSFGSVTTDGVGKVGHYRGYFHGDVNIVKDEALSIYAQMQFNEDARYLKMFRDDQPEIAAALDRCIENMLNSRR